MCVFLCNSCDEGSDEENYYILLDQYEEEDIYGDLIQHRRKQVRGPRHGSPDLLANHTCRHYNTVYL